MKADDRIDEIVTTARETLKALGNGEFLDLDSIGGKLTVKLRFGGWPMTLSTEDAGKTVQATICVEGDTYVTVFSVDFNFETNRPIILWEAEPPENIDLKIGVDVAVGLAVGLARKLVPELFDDLEQAKADE